MCGRLACGFEPKEICNSCCYKHPDCNQYRTPQWKDFYNSGKRYKPSYNICPKEVAPVLLSGSHFKINSRIVAPMLFGVVPQWSKGGETKYSTINCRIETAKTSKLYGNLLEKGQRCVVVCNGFFEWHHPKQSTNKKPYFIHGLQPDGVHIDDPESWKIDFTPEKGSSGYKPLRLAALFEINSFQNVEEMNLSFTIITKEANLETSWLHQRIPAILETDEQLDVWLNYEEVDSDHAIKYISSQSTIIQYFPVSDYVNQVNNKDISCVKQKKNLSEKGSKGFFKKWLEGTNKRKSDETLENACEKMKKKDQSKDFLSFKPPEGFEAHREKERLLDCQRANQLNRIETSETLNIYKNYTTPDVSFNLKRPEKQAEIIRRRSCLI